MPRDIDIIIERMSEKYPEVCIKQLEVTHPGDDDGLWFFWRPDSPVNVQIESSFGCCPFLIETDENDYRAEGQSVDEVLSILVKWLHLE